MSNPCTDATEAQDEPYAPSLTLVFCQCATLGAAIGTWLGLLLRAVCGRPPGDASMTMFALLMWAFWMIFRLIPAAQELQHLRAQAQPKPENHKEEN